MHALRIPVAIFVGGLFTSAMFWLLWSLVGTAFDELLRKLAVLHRSAFLWLERATAHSGYAPLFLAEFGRE